MTKTCTACHLEKETSNFYKHPSTADRLFPKCIECCSAYSKARQKLPSVIKSHREAERRRHQIVNHTEKYRIANNLRKKRSYYRNPQKQKARVILYRAIRDNLIQRRPCEECGSTIRIEAHHADYSKPLEVEWLCGQHHRMRHPELFLPKTECFE